MDKECGIYTLWDTIQLSSMEGEILSLVTTLSGLRVCYQSGTSQMEKI